jgi:hypothetical protein
VTTGLSDIVPILVFREQRDVSLSEINVKAHGSDNFFTTLAVSGNCMVRRRDNAFFVLGVRLHPLHCKASLV